MPRFTSHLSAILLTPLLLCALTCRWALAAGAPDVVLSEFIFDKDAPTKSCHASTLAQTKEGLAAAWFGGTAEGNKDVGIWLSLAVNGKWSAPAEVATGLQPDGSRFPCWNPVLYQVPAGPLQLYYKVGPNPRAWWGMAMESGDGGKTWSPPRRLPAGILEPPSRTSRCCLPAGRRCTRQSTEDDGWRARGALSDGGKTWSKTGPLNDPKTFGPVQPTILDHGPARESRPCAGVVGPIKNKPERLGQRDAAVPFEHRG